MTTVDQALRSATDRLAGAAAAPRLEAEILLGHALGRPRAWLLSSLRQPLANECAGRYAGLIEQRLGGCPVAYLVGFREFWSRPFRVTPAVLIPRPETEHLVEAALERIPPTAVWRLADLGTGSGAIAITLGLERPRSDVLATDVSDEALDVARDNALRLGAANVSFAQGDWFTAPGTAQDVPAFDLIASNPPYIAPGDPHLGEGDLRYEPTLALVAPEAGLGALRVIIEQARSRLRPGGWLLLEHGHDQSRAVTRLLRERGYDGVESLRDLAGHARIAVGRRPEGA